MRSKVFAENNVERNWLQSRLKWRFGKSLLTVVRNNREFLVIHSAPPSTSNLPKLRNVWDIDPIGQSRDKIVNMKHKKTTKQDLLILSQVKCMDVENKWLFMRVDLFLYIVIDSNHSELKKSPCFTFQYRNIEKNHFLPWWRYCKRKIFKEIF